MIQNQRGNLNYPAVELARAYKSMIRQGRDKKGDRAFERMDNIADIGLARAVPTDREFIFKMMVPIVMEFSVPGCLETERIPRGRIYHFSI